MSYIVYFAPYYHHGFVLGDTSTLLSLTPQNTYNMLATSTTNKASYQTLTHRCGILQSTPLKEPEDPIGTTRQSVRSALILNVTAQPNISYIIRFGPYRSHSFVLGDASPLMSLMPQNTYKMLVTSTTNKTSYQTLTHWHGILQSTFFKELDDPLDTTEQLVRSALIPNVTVRPNMSYIVCFRPYCPRSFILGDVSPLLSLTPQNAYNMLATNTTNKASYQTLTRQCGIL